MAMIDIKNLDKLTVEQRDQFNNLLTQFPHLESKMNTSRELNTPTKLEETATIEMDRSAPPTPASRTDEMDYSTFVVPEEKIVPTYRKNEMPSIKVNPKESFLKSFEQEKVQTKQEETERRDDMKKAAKEAGISPEVASFNPEGKTHPVLHKLRASMGLRSVQPPVVVDIGGCRYSLRALDRSSAVNATSLALTTTANKLVYETNLEVAIIAFSITAIDGVPLYDIFAIPSEEMEMTADGKQRMIQISRLEQEERASRDMYLELLKSPNELIETLGVYYQQEFPPLTLLGKDKVRFMCPVADCLQARIAESDSVCFCPVHGEKMASEAGLPNPS